MEKYNLKITKRRPKKSFNTISYHQNVKYLQQKELSVTVGFFSKKSGNSSIS
jgi:hypothetical protein